MSYGDISAAPVARPGVAPTAEPYGSPFSAGAAPSPGRAPVGARAPGVNLGYAAYTQAAFLPARSPKSRTAYIVLGVFLGAFGVHNFYAGYTARALGQVCLTIFTLPFVPFLAIVSWAWAVVEISIVDKDSNGLQFS